MALQSLIDNPKALLELINDCLKSKDIEKKKFGEVFTPMELVNEMLDKLPKEVWTNEKLKWLDPCCGMGNFPIAVYLRLMETLKEKINDNNERKKHILENMLYMCELNKKNVMICNQIFNINNEYKLNLYEGDSLELNYGEFFKVKNFDIIIGNPPYQKENKKNEKARGGTNNNLYLDFVTCCINLLNENGYLVFIHPLNWRKIGSKIFNEFINRNITYVKLNYGGHFFENISVKTDYYVLKNSKENNNITTIEYIINNKNYISNVLLNKTLTFLPNIYNEHINSIFNKINLYGKKYECIISSDCHKVRTHVKNEQNSIFKYKLFNTSGNPFGFYSSKPHKHQTCKKVILSNSGKLAPFYDNGELGTTQDSMYILVNSENEGNVIINAINSELFTFIIGICQWGNFRNEAGLFSYLKYPDCNKINKLTIDKYYKLSNDEINEINNKKIPTKNIDETLIIKKNTPKQEINVPVITSQRLVKMCMTFICGTNIEGSIENKTSKKPTFKIPYFTTDFAIRYCETFTYTGKVIICDKLNPGKYHVKNGPCSASSDMIIIALDADYHTKFNYIFEYIKNNFKYDATQTKSLKTQLQNFEIKL